MIRSLLVVGAALACAVSTPGQRRTWVLDSAGGAGSHFKTLAQAFAAAADGDVIVVRKGVYAGASTSKGLSLLGEANAIVIFPFPSPILIRDLPAGREFVIRGLDIRMQLAIRNCKGRVTIDRSKLLSTSAPISTSATLLIRDSRRVSVNESTVSGAPAVEVTDSAFSATDSELIGNETVSGHWTAQAGPGLSAKRGDVQITNGSVTGGNSRFTNFPPADAIVATDSALRITGAPGTLIAAGTGGRALPRSGIVGTGGTLILDPTVRVTGANNGPPIAGSIRVTKSRIPALRMTGAGAGGSVRGELFSRRGDSVFVLHGLMADPLAFAPFGGSIWLDLTRPVVVVGSGTQGASERFAVAVRLPNLTNIFGYPFGWQALSGDFTRGFVVSNPVVGAHSR